MVFRVSGSGSTKRNDRKGGLADDVDVNVIGDGSARNGDIPMHSEWTHGCRTTGRWLCCEPGNIKQTHVRAPIARPSLDAFELEIEGRRRHDGEMPNVRPADWGLKCDGRGIRFGRSCRTDREGGATLFWEAAMPDSGRSRSLQVLSLQVLRAASCSAAREVSAAEISSRLVSSGSSLSLVSDRRRRRLVVTPRMLGRDAAMIAIRFDSPCFNASGPWLHTVPFEQQR